MFTRSFPRVKRLGLSVDHPPSSSAEVKERVELYLYSSSWTSWSVLRWPSLFRIVFLALIWTRNFYILGTEIWHFNLFDKRMYSWNTEVRLQVVKDEERWEAYYQQGQRLICCPNWTHPPPQQHSIQLLPEVAFSLAKSPGRWLFICIRCSRG